jgi:hypothetical protein
MPDVHDAPMKGKGRDPSSTCPEPPPVHWDDPTQIAGWLSALHAQIQDALALGDDATRRPRRRFFARSEARRRLRAAERAIASLIGAAQRGLAPAAGPSDAPRSP